VNVFLSVDIKEDISLLVSSVKDLSKQLSDADIKKIITEVEIYSHFDHMDVGLVFLYMD